MLPETVGYDSISDFAFRNCSGSGWLLEDGGVDRYCAAVTAVTAVTGHSPILLVTAGAAWPTPPGQ